VRPLGLIAAVLSAAALLSACGSSESKSSSGRTQTPAAPAGINTSADQNRVVPEEVPSIAKLVPDEIRETGKLVAAIPVPGGGWPPSQFVADDNRTVIGSEADIATLVTGVLGLELEIVSPSWEGLFITLDKGDADVAFSNVTVTEQRKTKYDFATYRVDTLAFEAPEEADFTIEEPADVAGKTIAVDTGTNQEKILLDWARQVKEQGLDEVKLKYYPRTSQIILALKSGVIDAYLTSNPDAAYRSVTAGETKIVGTLSGGGDGRKGLLAATTLKDNGLVEALAAALNHTIESGEYAEVLDRWKLGEEAVERSEINPPGLLDKE